MAQKLLYKIDIDDDVFSFIISKSIKWIDQTPNQFLRRILLEEKTTYNGFKILDKESERTLYLHYITKSVELNILLCFIEQVVLEKLSIKDAYIRVKDIYSKTSIEDIKEECSHISSYFENITQNKGRSMYDSYLGAIERIRFLLAGHFPEYDSKIENYFSNLLKVLKNNDG